MPWSSILFFIYPLWFLSDYSPFFPPPLCFTLIRLTMNLICLSITFCTFSLSHDSLSPKASSIFPLPQSFCSELIFSKSFLEGLKNGVGCWLIIFAALYINMAIDISPQHEGSPKPPGCASQSFPESNVAVNERQNEMSFALAH